MISPSHRYLTVRDLIAAGSAAPVDTVMAGLYQLLQGNAASAEIEYAWDLFENDEHRGAIDAFLLAKCPTDLLSRVLGIPQNVVEAYEYLFLDMKALRNRLEVLSYAGQYEGPKQAQEVIRAGITVGLEYLLWLHGVAPEVDPRTVVRRTMVDAFYRGMAHRGNALTTNVTKEAHRWWSTAVRNAQLLEQLDPRATKAAYEELRIALEGSDETVTPDAAPVPVADILH